MAIEIKELDGVGAEILGVDLANLADPDLALIKECFAANGLVFFRDQSVTEQDHIALARKWGDINVRFDRGPSHARMIAPTEREFAFTARSWSAGTLGPVRGKVVLYPKTAEEHHADDGSCPVVLAYLDLPHDLPDL